MFHPDKSSRFITELWNGGIAATGYTGSMQAKTPEAQATTEEEKSFNSSDTYSQAMCF